MANPKNKKPTGGIHEVDAWTSNGYGLTIGGKKVEPLPEKEPEHDEIEEVEED